MAAPIGRLPSAVKFSSLQTMKRLCQWDAARRRYLYHGLKSSSKIQIRWHSQAPSLLQLQQRHMCYDSRHVDLTSSKQMFVFDTHALVKKLQYSGFTCAQAETIVSVLLQISQANLEHMNKTMVTKAQQEIMLQQIMSHISSIKKDMIILEKSEFSALKHEYEKQNIEINQIKQHFEDELTKQKSGVMLDLNLERSRAKDAHAENEHKLAHLVNKFEMGRAESDKHLSMLDNKIDKEIANLLATYERYRNDVIKYAAGTVLTCLTLCLGFLRLWS